MSELARATAAGCHRLKLLESDQLAASHSLASTCARHVSVEINQVEAKDLATLSVESNTVARFVDLEQVAAQIVQLKRGAALTLVDQPARLCANGSHPEHTCELLKRALEVCRI